MTIYKFNSKYYWDTKQNLIARKYKHEKSIDGKYYWVWYINDSFPIYTHEMEDGKITKIFIDAIHQEFYNLLVTIEGIIPSKNGSVKNKKFIKFRYSKSLFDGSIVYEGWKFIFMSEKAFENFLDLCEFYIEGGLSLAKECSLKMNMIKTPVTTKLNINNTRIGQHSFRKAVLKYWKSCAVTGCSVLGVLKASHIKPWANAQPNERLDSFNGILLIANFDALFDCGLITFTNDGNILISKRINPDQYDKLGIHSDLKLRKINTAHFPYLQYHRVHVFIDNYKN